MAHFPASDITGQRFGSLIAIKHVPWHNSHSRWLFRCDCGTEAEMFKSNVVRGHINQCEACGHKVQAKAITTHGCWDSPEYMIYQAAKQRCTNPNDARYRDYGGRGIQMRFTSFEHFIETVGKRPDGTTIDRIDNDGHYEPGNVRWVTPAVQATNRRPKRRQ